MKKALLVIDYINEICHPDGKLSWKWYLDFMWKHDTLSQLNSEIKKFRENWDEIIFVKVAFQKWYTDQPKGSPLLGKAQEFGILGVDTWSSDFLESLDIQETDAVIIKNRVSAFYSNLDEYLKSKDISDLYICGCATDLAVESTAREAHDRDYNVFILANACTAANLWDHERSLESLKKISTII